MVGAVRFELTTSCTRNKRASQATLRPDPEHEKMQAPGPDCNTELRKYRRARERGIPIPLISAVARLARGFKERDANLVVETVGPLHKV